MTVATLYGAWTGPDVFPSQQTKVEQRETVQARYGAAPLPIERVFNGSSWTLPLVGTGAQVISFDHDPAEVVAGKWDANVQVFAAALDPDIHYWLCLNHECDNPAKGLDPAVQRAAFARFHSVVHANRVSRKTKTAPIFMAYTLYHGGLDQWLPGPDDYDALGFDAYWRPGGPSDAQAVFGPPIVKAEELGKRLLICETSCGAVGHLGHDQAGQPLPDETYTTFVSEAVALLTGNARAVAWFEGVNKDGDGRLVNHPDALALWKAAVAATA